MSIVNGVDYLLTWNQKHLANSNKRKHLLTVARAEFRLHELVTLDLMRFE